MTSSQPAANAKRWMALAGLACLIAAALRAMFMDQGLWADEVQSIQWTQSTLNDLLMKTGLLDVHPPLYYVLLKGWLGIGAETDLWARLLSVLIGSASVGAFLLWAKNHLTRAPLLFATALVALSTWHIHYSVEVRSYVLLVLLAILLVWRVERWVAREENSSGDLVGIVTLSVAIGLTHYYGLFCLVGVNVYVFACSRLPPARLKRWAAWQAGVLGLLSWWLPFLFVQAFDLPLGFTAHLLEGPAVGDVLAAFGPATAAPHGLIALAGGVLVIALAVVGLARKGREPEGPRLESETPCPHSRRALATASLGLALPFVGLALIPDQPLDTGTPALNVHLSQSFDHVVGRLPFTYAALAVGWLALWGGTRLPERFRGFSRLPAAFFVIVAVLVIGGALHMIRPSFSLRNLLVLLPMVALLAGLGVERLGRAAAVGALIGTLLLAGVSLPAGPDAFEPRPDFRGVATYIHEASQAEEPQVYVISSFDNGALARYLSPLPSQGIMSPGAIIRVKRRPIHVLLTREAYTETRRFTRAFQHRFSPGYILAESVPFRQLHLLIFRPR